MPLSTFHELGTAQLTRNRILILDKMLQPSGSWLQQADRLLAKRLVQLELPLPEEIADLQEETASFEFLFAVLAREIYSWLRTFALPRYSLNQLQEQRKNDPDAADLYHVYAVNLYNLFLILERYGQEAGLAKGKASTGDWEVTDLNFTPEEQLELYPFETYDLLSHLRGVHQGKHFNSLLSFIFNAQHTLSLRADLEGYPSEWFYNYQGQKVASPHNPFERTRNPETKHAPTTVDISPFTDLLVNGELVGIEVNERLLKILSHLSPSLSPVESRNTSMEIVKLLIEVEALLDQAQTAYQEFNRSYFKPPHFAGVLRQFTVGITPSASEIISGLLEQPLSSSQSATLDHFLHPLFNSDHFDIRLLLSLQNSLEAFILENDLKAEDIQTIKEQLENSTLDLTVLVNELLKVLLLGMGIEASKSQLNALTHTIINIPREFIPSGSVSMAYAGLDIFFGIHDEIPTYWTHLLSRYPEMAPQDQKALDAFWEFVHISPTQSGAERLKNAFPSPEVTIALEKVAEKFARVTLAHHGVIKRFVISQSHALSTKSMISALDRGTTNMNFDPNQLLQVLAQKRKSLR